MKNYSHAYIAKKKCGCVVAACADIPDYTKDTAKFLADCVKDGLTIERVELGSGHVKLSRCRCEEQLEIMP